MAKLAVVTGANKGIGYEIVKSLSEQNGLHVILTSRDAKLGEEALQSINKPNVEFHQLDLNDQKSVEHFAQFIKDKYKGLDILINNAAIAFKGDAFDEHVARTTIDTNYFGTLRVLQQLLPLVRDGGRVVNVSSQAGLLSKLSTSLQKKFSDSTLTIEELSNLMNKFVKDIAAGTYQSEGWPQSTYAVSKIGTTALTKVFARNEKRNIQHFVVCPGWCATDMSSYKGPRSASKGAETPVWLALSSDSKASGGFFCDLQAITW